MQTFFWGISEATRWLLIGWAAGIIALYVASLWLRARAMRRYSAIDGARERLDNSSSLLRELRVGMLFLGIGALVVAICRPQLGFRNVVFKNKGIDIAICLDVSKSMLTRDVPEDRMKATALSIADLMDELKGGRVALIPFTSISWVQSPLVSDFEVIKKYIEGLDPNKVPVGGTKLGRAITKAIDVLLGEKQAAKIKEKGQKVKRFTGSKNKAIIIFSDGDDHDSNAIKAANLAKVKGIRIFTVGVGRVLRVAGKKIRSLHCVPDEVGDKSNTALQRCMQHDGEEVVAELNESLLKKVAEITGGAYFNLYRKPIIKELYARISKLEKQEYQATLRKQQEDRFQYALWPAVLFLFAELILGDRQWRRRKGRSG